MWLPDGARNGRCHFRCTALAAALTACVLGASPLYGEDYAAIPSRADTVTIYRDAIERAEVDYGPYAMELADLYLGLGRSLLELEELEAAADALQRGAHVVRINDGLDSPAQTDYLFSIADIKDYLGDWQSAIKTLDYVYEIVHSRYGENDPRLLPVLREMYEWYVKRRPLSAPGNLYADFQRHEQLAGRIASISERARGLSHPETAAIYRDIGQIQFEILRYLHRGGDVSIEPGLRLDVGMRPIGMGTDVVSAQAHFAAGTEAFAKMAEAMSRSESPDTLLEAEALAQLGDWYLANEKFGAAGDVYERAFRLLASNGAAGQAADVYFGAPVPVRFMQEEVKPLSEEPGAEGSLELTVSMTVLRSGTAKNVRILDAPEISEPGRLDRIARKLGDMRYRPRLNEGRPENFEGYVWNYRIPQGEPSSQRVLPE